MTWTKNLHAVLKGYPSIVGSKNWPEVVRLANQGDVAGAKAVAARSEVSPLIQRRNVIARRHRIERTEFLSRVVGARRQLHSIFDHYTTQLQDRAASKADQPSATKRINEIVHEETISLRASLRIFMSAALRDSAKMGYKHIADALLPIFRANMEQIEQQFLADRALFEAKLTFGLKKGFAARAATSLAAPKWADAQGKVIRRITQKTLKGLRPVDRIWDLTQRTNLQIRRIIANGMGEGVGPKVIASRIKRFVSPALTDAQELGVEVGPGAYRSPYANAYRLAKTEMNRAYTQATIQFAKDKPWTKDGDIVLSPVHAQEDDCDDLVSSGPYTPEEAGRVLPLHSHCGCSYVPRIDPAFLGEEPEE